RKSLLRRPCSLRCTGSCSSWKKRPSTSSPPPGSTDEQGEDQEDDGDVHDDVQRDQEPRNDLVPPRRALACPGYGLGISRYQDLLRHRIFRLQELDAVGDLPVGRKNHALLVRASGHAASPRGKVHFEPADTGRQR